VKNLWAPWRMEFIGAIEKEEGCFLCRAAGGGEASPRAPDLAEADRVHRVVHRGRHCFCLLNRYPYNNGHLLIAPYAHVADLEDLDDEGLLDLMRTLRRARRLLTETVHAHGFNIGLNLGPDAGAGLADHLHVHLVPRWRGDTNFMPVLAETKVIPQALDALYADLKARWEAVEE